MTNYFLLDPYYKDFPMRGKIRFSTVYGGQYRFIGFTLLLFLAICAIVLLYTLYLIPDELRFIQDGIRRRGIVTETCTSKRDRFTYTYEVEAGDGSISTYTGGGSPGKNYPCPKLNGRILVEYLRSEPQISRATTAGTSNYTYLCGVSFGVLFMLAISIMEFGHIRAYLQARPRYKRLQKGANEVEGKILAIRGYRGDKSDGYFTYFIEVKYEFEMQDKRIRGTQIKKRWDLRDQPLPPAGTSVRVLFADADAYVML